MNKKNISITIDPKLYQEVRDTATAAKQSISSIISDMIEASMRGTYDSYPLFLAVQNRLTIDRLSSIELDLVGSYPDSIQGAFFPEPMLAAQYGVVAMPLVLTYYNDKPIRVKFFNMTGRSVTLDTSLPVGELVIIGGCHGIPS